jgi:phosphosulfolactate synthase (CoM biosynthesis protein A)
MTATIPSSGGTMIPTGRAASSGVGSLRGVKPRSGGLTQIHGRYYNAAAQRRLADELETMGSCVDSLEFTGGPFSVLRPHPLASVIELCRRHAVAVSAGGLSERVLMQSAAATDRYIGACRDLGVDIMGLSSRVTTWLCDDWRRLVQRIRRAGLKVRPAIGLGAGVPDAIRFAQDCVQAGADLVVLESPAVTDHARRWRTDIAARLIEAVGLESIMLEATEPDLFTWYVRHFGPEVNLFVEHNHVALLECLRAGVWTDPCDHAAAPDGRSAA